MAGRLAGKMADSLAVVGKMVDPGSWVEAGIGLVGILVVGMVYMASVHMSLASDGQPLSSSPPPLLHQNRQISL